MKKLLLYSILLLSAKVFAQALPNGSFETWSSNYFAEPTGWYSANFNTLKQMAVIPVTKVAGFAGYAVHIETTIAGTDTTKSFVSNTKPGCGPPSAWQGGVPYSELPTAITGYYRYNLPGNDTALLLVIFKKNSVNIGNNVIKIKGTGSMPTFTAFSFPVTATMTPDTMIIVATSSNLLSNNGIENGSFLELDNLAFTGTASAIPAGDFELWSTRNITYPTGWDGQSMDETGIAQTTDSYAGTSATLLTTLADNCGNVQPSGITTGHMARFSGPASGRPYSNTTDTLCGYYKYTSMANDSATISVTLSLAGSNIGGYGMKLPAAASYTYFQMPFNSATAPDTIRIDAQSSKWPNTFANAGSALYLDLIWLKSAPGVGILSYDNASDISVYPNPVTDFISVNTKGEFMNTPKLLSIYNALGAKVYSISSDKAQVTLDLKSFAKGIYMIEIKCDNKITTKRFVKE